MAVSAETAEEQRKWRVTVLKITVYALPDEKCPQCKYTKKRLTLLGLEFEVIDVEADASALATVKEMGFSAAPVVVVDWGDGATWTWQGFAPSRIEEMMSRLRELVAA